ncbi:unnamed protein product [Chrysoparadoxa australica]
MGDAGVEVPDRDIRTTLPPSRGSRPPPQQGNVHCTQSVMLSLPNPASRSTGSLVNSSSRTIPWKTVVAAVGMVLLGLVLLGTSLDFEWYGYDGALVFFVLGLIVVIPGAYASVQLYGAYRRWPGYHFNQISSYDYV